MSYSINQIRYNKNTQYYTNVINNNNNYWNRSNITDVIEGNKTYDFCAQLTRANPMVNLVAPDLTTYKDKFFLQLQIYGPYDTFSTDNCLIALYNDNQYEKLNSFKIKSNKVSSDD